MRNIHLWHNGCVLCNTCVVWAAHLWDMRGVCEYVVGLWRVWGSMGMCEMCVVGVWYVMCGVCV